VNTRCYGCMKIKENHPICEHCGFDERNENSDHQLPAGTVVGNQYTLGRVLGQGGFGITYIGWDNILNQTVAVKEYFPSGYAGRNTKNPLWVTSYDTASNHTFDNNKRRFLREAEALAKLWDIPQIVRVLRHFEDNGTAYIAMEYVEGVNLKVYLQKLGRPLTVEELFTILGPVVEALNHVHQAELVHRDISPDNIMVLPDGSAKLLDFGAARYVENADASQDRNTSTQAILKHGFAPPEQYRSHGALGPWTDIYALCATIYFCLTGKVPPESMSRMMREAELDLDSVPGLTQQQKIGLEKGMDLFPKQRIKTVNELYQQLFGEMIASREKATQEATNTQPRPKKEYAKEREQKVVKAQILEKENQKQQAQKSSAGNSKDTSLPKGTNSRQNSHSGIKLAFTAVAAIILLYLGTQIYLNQNPKEHVIQESYSTGIEFAPETSAATQPTVSAKPETTSTGLTHAEYIAAPLDSEVTIETYVQGHQSWWENKITVYCQSPDGAYFLYELACSEEDAAKLVPGTKILVKGYKGEWAGEVEIMYPTFEFVEGGDTFIAEAVDVTELLGTDELIAHQNEFVSFKGLTIEAIEYKNGEPGDDSYVTVGYNGASYSFCVERYLTAPETEVYTTVGTLNVGDVVNVEGFLYWYEGVNTHITAISLA